MEQADIDRNHLSNPTLSQKIIGWTNNLLATSVVIVIALAVGTQLVSSWRPTDEQPTSALVLPSDAWPALQDCSLSFGDSPFQIQRSVFLGSEDEVIHRLKSQCKDALIAQVPPVGDARTAEIEMLAGLKTQTPVDQDLGKWRIFLVRKTSQSNDPNNSSDQPKQLPQVIGIRDNCPSSESGNETSRLVVWGLAMAADQGNWTTFVGRSSDSSSVFGIGSELLPKKAKRTLALAEPETASVIGFTGSDLELTKAHFDGLSEVNSWKANMTWQQNENNWTRSYAAGPESSLQGIQVQLNVNHTQASDNSVAPVIRGMITLTAAKNIGKNSNE